MVKTADESQNQMRDEGLPSHAWRTEIPNTIFDYKLSPATFLFYAYVKRVAGDDNACWQSLQTMAAALGLSPKTIIKAKFELKQAGLITVEKRFTDGAQESDLITVVDIWEANYRTSKQKRDEARVQRTNNNTPPMENLHTPYGNFTYPPMEILHTKKIPLKEDPIEEEEKTPASSFSEEPTETHYMTVTMKLQEAVFSISGVMIFRESGEIYRGLVRLVDAKGMDAVVSDLRRAFDGWTGRGWKKTNPGWLERVVNQDFDFTGSKKSDLGEWM